MNGSIASHIARRLGPWMRVRPASVAGSAGAISFTFDDFPKSALHEGARILEKYGARGTYYTALGLAGGDSNVGEIASLDEIRETHQRGHELACHSFSHLDCSRVSVAEIVNDLERNTDAFAALLDGFAPENFAYPYGRYLLPSKRLVSPRYATCRGTAGGVNHGTADFADLRGTRIYAPGFDGPALRKLIDRNRALGGWLIFYTHDVSGAPSPYGCTPEQFEGIVAYAAEHAPLLPIRDVVTRLESARVA